jgi:diguanylate cyclase (GGDEF)-like protein
MQLTTAGYAAYALLLAGVGLMVYSLRPASRILAEMPEGVARGQWHVLRGFIALFIAGYFGALVFFPSTPSVEHLIVAGVFFGGALFVVIVCRTMLASVRDYKRIAVLERENVMDPLMGIYNRRHLERRLEEESSRVKRYGTPLSICMMDIDHFKKINDNYGHQAGDIVLERLGAMLRAGSREIDVAARYGGEEFVLLLPNTGEEEARSFAERSRREIEKTAMGRNPADGRDLRCTMSFGVATTAPGEHDGAEILRRADRALYQAKQAGRNRVVVYRADGDPPAPARAAP